jgi:hypothetical protein
VEHLFLSVGYPWLSRLQDYLPECWTRHCGRVFFVATCGRQSSDYLFDIIHSEPDPKVSCVCVLFAISWLWWWFSRAPAVVGMVGAIFVAKCHF